MKQSGIAIQEETASGEKSSFNKLVSRNCVEESRHKSSGQGQAKEKP